MMSFQNSRNSSKARAIKALGFLVGRLLLPWRLGVGKWTLVSLGRVKERDRRECTLGGRFAKVDLM